jgi:hypothetical protein
MRRIFYISSFTILLMISNAFSVETGLTIYNSTSNDPDQFKTVYIVLRQAPRKIAFYHCYGAYAGGVNDSYASEQYFRTRLASKNCIKAREDRRKIVGLNNNVRYIYSFLQIIELAKIDPDSPSGFVTSASTLTVDANDDLGKAPGSENIIMLHAYVSHRELDNPTIASDRRTNNLSGYAIIQFPEIRK